MKQVKKIIALAMLVFAIGFNLWLYRLEPTATTDPNDNTFQYALVDRTNQIWDFAHKSCTSQKQDESKVKKILVLPVSLLTCFAPYLLDHWVPNWAQGYNLPTYYSHVPQIMIVGSYRLLSFFSQFQISNFKFQIDLFTYYHLIIYLLLSLFPLSVFLALRVVRLPWLVAGIGALLASHISTDGLYGLDPASFLWRGYGLSSQLFAMIPLPLTIAYSWKFFEEKKSSFVLPVLFLIATTSGHLGVGIIAILSLIPLAFAEPVMLFLCQRNNEAMQYVKNNTVKLFLLSATTIFFLSYWIIPILLGDNYHNISIWDPPWKFNSFGAKEIMIRLFNGDLFDFGRFPVLTALVIVGIFACFWKKFEARNPKHETNSNDQNSKFKTVSNVNNVNFDMVSNFDFRYSGFAFLFLFFLLLYFGRATWGGLIDAIPGMKEFHLSRFIVGLHAAGFFLAPIGIWWILTGMWSRVPIRFLFSIKIITVIILILVIGISVFPQTIRYNELNDKLILQANANYAKGKPDAELLITELKARIKENPGRVFAGRGGDWGKNFRVAETPYNIFLSTFGIPVVLWLPQTWSPNSDVEQYFSADNLSTYFLFGIRYVVAPPTAKTETFWQLVKETARWKLYVVTPLSVIPAKPAPAKAGEPESTQEKNWIPGQTRDDTVQDNAQGYFTTGVRPTIVATDKRSYTNVVRLWIQSDKTHAQGLYPELTFAKDYPKETGLPNFKMLDEVTYVVPDGSTHNLFREPPLYLPPGATNSVPIQPFNRPTILSQSVDTDMIFKAKIRVPKDCTECIVVLKQSSHPNWRVTIDRKGVDHFNVFPVFVAVTVPEGDHDLVFSYKPSRLKISLLLMSAGAALLLVFFKTTEIIMTTLQKSHGEELRFQPLQREVTVHELTKMSSRIYFGMLKQVQHDTF